MTFQTFFTLSIFETKFTDINTRLTAQFLQNENRKRKRKIKIEGSKAAAADQKRCDLNWLYLRIRCEIPGFDAMHAQLNHLDVFHSCNNIILMRDHTARLSWRARHYGRCCIFGIFATRNQWENWCGRYTRWSIGRCHFL